MAYAQSHAITAKKEPKRNRQQHQQQLLQVETPTEQYLVNATRVWFFLSFFSSHQYLVVCVALASYVRKKSTHTPTSKPASQHQQQQQQQIEFECEHVKFCIWKPKMCFIFDVCFSCYFLFHSIVLCFDSFDDRVWSVLSFSIYTPCHITLCVQYVGIFGMPYTIQRELRCHLMHDQVLVSKEFALPSPFIKCKTNYIEFHRNRAKHRFCCLFFHHL